MIVATVGMNHLHSVKFFALFDYLSCCAGGSLQQARYLCKPEQGKKEKRFKFRLVRSPGA
jgi:hypothetical protein